ncbi:MAG TPA: substrate-binding domain-containing protein [Anaerolineae bacterium]|nr:substrate-binding domain-containing protein [Anaerolineae bacterium]
MSWNSLTPESTPQRNARPTIGLLIQMLAGLHGYVASLWAGVLDAAEQYDANLFCLVGGGINGFPTDKYQVQGNVLYELAQRGNIHGLIVNPTLSHYVSPEQFDAFCRRYRPRPIVGAGLRVKGSPSVLVDNAGGLRRAVEHLIQAHGYRQIAFIGGPASNAEARLRYQVYAQVLAEHGLPLEPALVAPGDFTVPAGEKAIPLLLDERQAKFRAIVAANDNMARGAMDALQARGIRVPHDVAIVGFDDTEEARVCTPALTTVRQPISELGQRAVEMLLALLAGKPVAEETTLPTELVVHESCGCLDPVTVQAAQQSAEGAQQSQHAAQDLAQLADQLQLAVAQYHT